ncbi:hypothetical protein [Streptomyces sp. NPDC057257]|uniref:hypothetical protein n=1 Tax=Streptomyces sp. NPDC057257 TaxID=3346071 RepID=UPI003635FC8A
MRAPHALRTALVTAGLTAAVGLSATAAFAEPAVAVAQHQTKRVHVRTVKLADKVSRAKVFTTGKHRYQAEIWAKGVKHGTLSTKGWTAYGNLNGLHVALHPNGKVTSWVERAKPRPKPVVKRVLIASATLADGTSTAKIYKLTANHHEADIYANGVKIGTLVADGRAAYGENNGLHIALRPDGRITSWAEEVPSPDPTPQPDDTDQPEPIDAVTPDTPAVAPGG